MTFLDGAWELTLQKNAKQKKIAEEGPTTLLKPTLSDFQPLTTHEVMLFEFELLEGMPTKVISITTRSTCPTHSFLL
jgi:hypothetical protein